ncbi:hypothetical protein ACF08M_33530 [Streptomyces sp. NPDC015032]|uniref:hypothetical protein n=1 Tax=Streptomyces sp. NPDC015032 TaxID=3364937 RepID=UPI0036FE881B
MIGLADPGLGASGRRCLGGFFTVFSVYIRWRNNRAEPKTNFAPDSPIRQWTEYPAKAA